MPKDTKTLGNNKARACESLGFVHKKRLCQRFDTTSFFCFYFSFKNVGYTLCRLSNTFIIPYKYHEEMFFYEFFCVYYNKYLYLH